MLIYLCSKIKNIEYYILPEHLIGANYHRLLVGVLAVAHLQHHMDPHELTVATLHLDEQDTRSILL